jgi:type IV secretory pathway VirJ component
VDESRRKVRKRTSMLSLNDRQSSKVTMSGWFGRRMVERDLPPNMGEIDTTGLAYSRP